MPIDVQRFRKNTRPTNLLSLMDEVVLDTLLNGFCYALEAGVAERLGVLSPYLAQDAAVAFPEVLDGMRCR